ncbi:sensor histidine kinase [Nocardia huaxiensis]|uniref:sensor histidine kinase n=1 Tax=Nocardia huaxiensis TaxID=2755382 RepID=UPI001E53F3D9|nr:HAMP domain-containing sensor histidine kinase [Nocardia huaxiensis]UFS93789.1 HAMP domain-containing histidine kinase [Nocardia huaxiensis]
MEATPRSWQFSLSNWPVTRKVGIVLVLPVLLASTFAVLRIDSELQTIDKLRAATEHAAFFRPTIKFESATQELAVTAIAGWGNPDADPALDTATGKFDQAVADLESQLRATKAGASVTDPLTEAIAMAKTMKSGLKSGSAAGTTEQMQAVSAKVQSALNQSDQVSDMRVQPLFLQVGSAIVAERMFTEQRMMLASPDITRNPITRIKLITVIGAEVTMLGVYSAMNAELAPNSKALNDSAQARIGMLAANTADPNSMPGMQESLRAASDMYSKEINAIAAELDDRLGDLTTEARNNVLRDTSIVVGMLLAGLAIALVVARSLVVPVRRLRRDALQVAHIDLPQELETVRNGGATPEISPVDVHTTEEIGQLARAVDDIHAQALHLAAEQARLRLQIGNMFETLSRRSQSLVEQQLTLIEELERDEDDSERLQSLFRLDHLATRMRRNGDNLLVLAGTALRRGHLAPVPLSDMLWSSVSQVEDYQRVEIGTVPDGIVAGEPAVDVEHLLAELIDNALRYSPPSTPVAVSVARAVDGGYLIEITDRGLGMNAEDLQSINDRLASGGEVNVETARRMGLFVVGRLAKRHNITVSLRRTSAMVQQPGITASVHLPGTLVSPAPERNNNGGDATGQYPLTGAVPVAAPAIAAAPAVSPPRLMPVANPPEPQALPQRFGTTSSGLPQRRPGNGPETGEQPVVAGYIGDQPTQSYSFSDAFTEHPAATDDGMDDGRHDPVTAQYQADYWRSRPDTVTPITPIPTRRDAEDSDNSGAQQPNGLPPLPSRAETNGADGNSVARFRDSADSNGFDRNGYDSNGDAAFGTNGSTGSYTTGSFEAVRGDVNADAAPADSAPAFESAPGDTGFDLGGNGHDSGRFGVVGQDGNDQARDAFTGNGIAEQASGNANGANGNSAGTNGSAENGARFAAFTPQQPVAPQQPAAPQPPAAPQRPAAPQSGLRPVGDAPTPIFQRMVSEWLVEPAAGGDAGAPSGAAWSSTSDAGWAAAAEAANPTSNATTQGGLPIRRPGAQLVPGAVAQDDQGGARNPDEIRSSLTRHLSGVRSGRADAEHNDGGQA